ncbi:MAG: hypothetical protein GY708_14400 [Actinomycetia bacterium]|nr:hypothetical protein [Actinomycetes bacterium]MCP4961796.1 hypothetical protein [Actinomycetes bacterium]
MNGDSRHTSLDETGAAAIILALSMTVLMGAAAIVLDAGDIWQQRRQLVGAVDAGALAAAAEFATGSDGCDDMADDYVVSNAPDTDSIICTASENGGAGQVTVSSSVTVTHALAQVLGRDSTEVTASSTARWGPATAMSGLRPFGLCEGSPGFEAWQASGHSTEDVFRIQYSKDQANACGGPAPGNWGMLDFNGGSNSNNETKDWVRYGYPGEVEAPQWIEGDPGAFSPSLPISDIVGDVIQVPVFDGYNGAGGANAEFHVIGFVSLIIVDYKANGQQAKRYLDVQFQSTIAAGKCCDGATVDMGTSVVGLCAVEDEGSCG